MIAQDLPPILEGMGVHLEPEPQQVIQEDAKEILKRFRARPAKYAGREITVRCRVTGEVSGVDEKDCLAFRLPIGDTIERKVVHLVDEYRITYIMAAREMADWLEDLPKETEVTIRIKLLSGTKDYQEWYDNEPPSWTTKLIRGYQVTEIIEQQ
jgi:hypothetical protein